LQIWYDAIVSLSQGKQIELLQSYHLRRIEQPHIPCRRQICVLGPQQTISTARSPKSK